MKRVWSRIMKPEDVEEWLIGEKENMLREFGFGFFKTETKKEGDFIAFYYDENELKAFEKHFENIMTEDKFHEIASKFMKLFYKKDAKLRQLVTAYTIFNVYEEYPEYMEGMSSIQRRLKRIREWTEDFGEFK